MNEGQEPYPTDAEAERLADALWRGVESLNRATAGGQGLEQPGTVFSVAGSLVKMADGLHQTLQNLGERLIQELDSKHIARGFGQDVLRAQDLLAESGKQSLRLEQSLIRVQESLGTVYGAGRGVNAQGRTLQAGEQKDEGQDMAAPRMGNADFPTGIGELLERPAPLSEENRTRPHRPPGSQPRPPL